MRGMTAPPNPSRRQRRILLTAALPYANGDIHIGHLVEYIQADIWARFQKLCGHECWFVCADDAHGTPIMLRAEAEGTTPEALIARMQQQHTRDFAAFDIAFDNYHTTHSDENRSLSERVFTALQNCGLIVEREIEQLYDADKNMFLPDRYVRGTCPRCAAAEQYGDSCEQCGAAYTPQELKNPVSVLSGKPPVLKNSKHYFLHLSREEDDLRQWLNSTIQNAWLGAGVSRLQPEAINKLSEWLQGGLRDWDISRDPPYFGFRIPGIAEEKYFYVWLDAPIGYIASFQNLCNKQPDIAFADFWRADKNADDTSGSAATELYHFIGKDILYFHGLFWQTMLKNAGYRQPTQLFVHGFLMVNGEKMSKSRGTFITAARYLQTGLSPQLLRYYYACKMGDKVEDIDFNLNDFMLRVNSDLVGKLFNIPSRVAKFIAQRFDGKLDGDADDAVLPARTVTAIATAYEGRRYHEAVRLLMRVADDTNAAIEAAKPWQLAQQKTAEADAQLHALCSRALRRFDLIIGFLSPVVPALAAQAAAFLARPPYAWEINTPAGIAPLPPQHGIGNYQHLAKRMEVKTVEKLIQPEKPSAAPAANKTGDTTITIDDFAKVDLRVATVVSATAVEGADKLLRLQLDIGTAQPRQVFAGIKSAYTPEELIGQQVLYAANLKPRKMRFGTSVGMVLAATDSGGVVLLNPKRAVAAGSKVR